MRILPIALLILLAACQPAAPPEMTDADKAQIGAEVLEAAAGIIESFQTMDAGAIMEGFHPTETSWAWGGSIHRHASFSERLGLFFDTWESWDGGLVEGSVKVLNADAVMFQGKYESTIHYTDGRVLHWPGNASFTMLMERTIDGWKATTGGWSNGVAEVVEEG